MALHTAQDGAVQGIMLEWPPGKDVVEHRAPRACRQRALASENLFGRVVCEMRTFGVRDGRAFAHEGKGEIGDSGR